MALNSSGFNLDPTALPQAPNFGSLGTVDPVDYGKILQLSLANIASQNQTAANQSAIASQGQQRQQSAGLYPGALALQGADVGQAQTSLRESTENLPVSQEKSSLEMALLPQQAAVESALSIGKFLAAQRQNDLLKRGTAAVPGIQAQIAKIDQLPDPMDQYRAYADLQANNADVLGHPALSSTAQVLNERATQALGRVSATAAQTARLQQIAAVNATRENVAGIQANSREAVAGTNAVERAGAAGGALNVATQRVQDAEADLKAALSSGDENAIQAAENALTVRNNTLSVARKAAGGRASTPFQGRNPPPPADAGGAVPLPTPNPAGPMPPAGSAVPLTSPATLSGPSVSVPPGAFAQPVSSLGY